MIRPHRLYGIREVHVTNPRKPRTARDAEDGEFLHLGRRIPLREEDYAVGVPDDEEDRAREPFPAYNGDPPPLDKIFRR